MNNFEKAFRQVIDHEGTYSNDPDDRGGETYKGISRKKHPHWGGWSLIDSIKVQCTSDEIPRELEDHSVLQEVVREFYKKNFWDEGGLDQFPFEIAFELFDTGVNQGMGQAIMYLQEALNMNNGNERYWNDMPVDGMMGPKTRNGFEAYMETAHWSTRTQKRVINVLVKTIGGLQFQRYRDIVKKDPSQEKFFFGWINKRI